MLRKYMSMVEKNNQFNNDRPTVGRSASLSHMAPANQEQCEMIAAYNFLSSQNAQYEDEKILYTYIDDMVSNNRLVSGFNYVVELFVWLSERENQNGLLSSITIRKSIVSLVRRMRRECSAIKNILVALITHGRVSDNCCVINKTQDGRLQVDGNKRFPHILSFQLFRSPYVRSKNDLNSTPRCHHPFHSDDHLVCLNPYHYVLTSLFIQKSLMANFYTYIDSRLIMEASCDDHSMYSFKGYGSIADVTMANTTGISGPTPASELIYNPPVNPFDDNTFYYENLSLTSHDSFSHNHSYYHGSSFLQQQQQQLQQHRHHHHHHQPHPHLQQQYPPQMFESNVFPLRTPVYHRPAPQKFGNDINIDNAPFLPMDNGANDSGLIGNESPANDVFEEIRKQLKLLLKSDTPRESTPITMTTTANSSSYPTDDSSNGRNSKNSNDLTPVHVVENGRNCGLFTINSNNVIPSNNMIISMDGKYIVAKNKAKYMSGQQIADSYMFHSDDTSTDRYSAESSTLDFHPIGEMGAHNSWCSIIYHEFDKQIGEVTHVPQAIKDAYIDGYTNVATIRRNSFRLSVAQLNTSSNRDEAVNRCINNIGKGIRIKKRSGGNVSIRCLSESSIFIHSYFMDVESKSPVGGAVHKVLTDVSVNVFIWEYFVRETEQSFNLLEQMIHAYKRTATNDNNYNRAKINEILNKFRATIETLQSQCVISLSFVKGWGYNYTRNTVSSTPCWIELYANDAIAFLEELSGSFWTVFNDACVTNTAPYLDLPPNLYSNDDKN